MFTVTSMAELTAEECLALLGTRSVGRIALTTPAGLRIFPVSYVLDDDTVVFRTVPYGVIANSAHDAEVAFEVDDLDHTLSQGWSVVLAGRCRRIEDAAEVRMIRTEHDPQPWAEGARILYLRITWDDLTGRRIGS